MGVSHKKKGWFLLVAGVSAVALLAGCSLGADPTKEKQDAVKKKEEEERAKREEEKPKVEMDQVVGEAWKDSDGKIRAHGGAEIKNIGKKPIEFDSIRLNFLDQQGKVIGKKDVLAVVPKILKPGESAYVGATIPLKSAKDDKDFKEVAVQSKHHPALKKPVRLHVEQLQMKKAKGNQPFSVTGTVENTQEMEAQDIFVVIGIKDKKGNLLGVLSEYLDTAIPPGESEKFKAWDKALPRNVLKKASEVEAHAYPIFLEDEEEKEKKKE